MSNRLVRKSVWEGVHRPAALPTLVVTAMMIASVLVGCSKRRPAANYVGCPRDDTVITEDLILEPDLVCHVVDKDRPGVFIVGASNVTLDCNGTTIIGPGFQRPDIFRFGVHGHGYENVTIKNCGVSNYGDGMIFMYMKNLTLTGNVLEGHDNGVALVGVDGALVSGNRFGENANGLNALSHTRNARITDNVFRKGNAGVHVQGAGRCEIDGNRFEGLSVGVDIRAGVNYANEVGKNKFTSTGTPVARLQGRSFTAIWSLEPNTQDVSAYREDRKVMSMIARCGDVFEYEEGDYRIRFSREGYSTTEIAVRLDRHMVVRSTLQKLRDAMGYYRDVKDDSSPSGCLEDVEKAVRVTREPSGEITRLDAAALEEPPP